MTARPVLIAVHELGYGGLTHAVLDQSRIFVASGHPTTIATLAPDPGRHRARVAELRAQERLARDVDVLDISDERSPARRDVVARGWRAIRRAMRAPDREAPWLAQVAARSPRPIVLAESPGLIPRVASISPRVATRLAMLHNNQFAAPYAPGSPLREDHVRPLRTAARLDGLVVLTDQQRDDLRALLGPDLPLHVVPNTVDVPTTLPSDRDGRLVSIVSRLTPQKALHEAVAAMELVLQTVPDARLEIYGRGRSRPELDAAIAASGHADRIVLRGRTDDPTAVMARSACTLSTSDWEAMPLTILESMAVATPVVAYDCRYGPAALIEDGVTGRLVRQGDRRTLAEAVIDLLLHPGSARTMGEAARAHVVQHHSPTRVGDAWESMLSAAPAPPRGRR